jgi:iron(II)-dependent oxidoreductase
MATARPTVAGPRELVAGQLETARAYTEALLAPLADADLETQVSPIQSPLVWDLAHIAHYEELWLVRNLGAGIAADERRDDVYDAFRHARHERASLELLRPDEARAYAADVRRRSVAVLARVEPDDDPLLADWFVYGLVVQHELQHNETMCQTLQLDERLRYPHEQPPAARRVPVHGEAVVPGGAHVIGTSDLAWAYDNEREAHEVELAPYAIDRAPVTNGRYLAFVEAGGYRDRTAWSSRGWDWRTREGAEAPLYWSRDADGTWTRRRLGTVEPLPPDEPVQHVSWFEADAFARWEGRRLPTEQEWEAAAAGSAPAAANTGRARLGPAPVGSYPAGASSFGCHQMLGDVWEWTSSNLTPYPGFHAFPYREYTEVFFGGDYKVLRGGSWATHPLVARRTFRNWDHPYRRQIFAGFRTARDA